MRTFFFLFLFANFLLSKYFPMIDWNKWQTKCMKEFFFCFHSKKDFTCESSIFHARLLILKLWLNCWKYLNVSYHKSIWTRNHHNCSMTFLRSKFLRHLKCYVTNGSIQNSFFLHNDSSERNFSFNQQKIRNKIENSTMSIFHLSQIIVAFPHLKHSFLVLWKHQRVIWFNVHTWTKDVIIVKLP